MVVQYLFFLSLAALCAMCTGTKVATTVMYFLLNFGSWLIFVVVQNFYQPLITGMELSSDWAVWLSPISKIVSSEYWIFKQCDCYPPEYIFVGLSDDWWYLLILGVLTLGLVALGILAYRKRQLENAGEFVAFRPLKFFIWLPVALTIGLMFQGIGMLSGTHTISLLFGLVVGGLLSEMLVAKTVKAFPKGLLKGVILVAVVGLSMLIVVLNPWVRWVPEAEDVEWVQISDTYNYMDDYDYYDSQILRDPEDIRQIVDIHKQLLDDSISDSDFASVDWDYGQIYIKYHMTDGSEVVRKYYYPTDSEAAELIEPLWTRAEFVLGYDDWEKFLQEHPWITIQGKFQEYQLDEKQTKELLTAIKNDCDEGTWDQSGEWKCRVGQSYYKWIDVHEGSYHTVKWIRRNYPEAFLNNSYW